MWIPTGFGEGDRGSNSSLALQAGQAGDEEPAQVWQCLMRKQRAHRHVGMAWSCQALMAQAPGVDFAPNTLTFQNG